MNVQIKPNDLEAFWMPFTANRQFKANPRMFVGAKDMHYITDDGRKVLDGTAGLWCVNAGHCRPKIVEAIKQQVDELDYAPALPDGPSARPSKLANASRRACTRRARPRLLHQLGLGVGRDRPQDRASPISAPRARASRVRLIGRERGYHGVNFGGMSVGGIGRQPQDVRRAR